jgi:hypothetical protein
MQHMHDGKQALQTQNVRVQDVMVVLHADEVVVLNALVIPTGTHCVVTTHAHQNTQH